MKNLHQHKTMPEQPKQHRRDVSELANSPSLIASSAFAFSPAAIMNLQRAIGNQAVLRLLQRNTVDDGSQLIPQPTAIHIPNADRIAEPSTLTAKAKLQITPSTKVGINRQVAPEPVVSVARDFLEKIGEVGTLELIDGARSTVEIEDRLRVVAGTLGPHAGVAQQLLDQIDEVMDVKRRSVQLNTILKEARSILKLPGRRTRASQVEWGLERLWREKPDSPEGIRAKHLQSQIERLRTRISELDKARIATEGGKNAYKGSAAKKIAGTVEKGGVKSEQTAVKVGSSGAKTGQTATKTEITVVQAGGETADALSDAVKVSRAAKLGAFLVAVLPGPLDVLFLWIGFFGSLAEAKQKLKEEHYVLGFVQGLAAGLLGFEADWALEHLQNHSVNPSAGERVAGFEGVRERANNRGVVDGWRFGGRLTSEQQNAFRADGLATMAQKKKRIGQVRGENVTFNVDDIIALGVSLKPRIEMLFDVAREQEAERLRLKRRMEQENKRREGTSGHGKMRP